MANPTKKANLEKAKKAKQDEFYTQLTDVEKELEHYKKHFRGKVVYCNCDDPTISNFYLYLKLKFEELGLKRLMTTCYKNDNIDSFSRGTSKQAIWLEYDGKDEIKRRLNGDGDFRSEECVALLDQADIVVTNPPFSLFREFVAQLVEHGKKFIIVGNKNALTYKDIFKLVAEDKIRTGYRNINSDMWFEVPRDAEYEKIVNGKRVKHIMATWFTNLEVRKHAEKMLLHEKYTPAKNPRYDNYNAIEVGKVAEIPKNYKGVMGVPFTYLGSHDPRQFNILGHAGSVGADGVYSLAGAIFVDGEKKFKRVLIRRIQ